MGGRERRSSFRAFALALALFCRARAKTAGGKKAGQGKGKGKGKGKVSAVQCSAGASRVLLEAKRRTGTGKDRACGLVLRGRNNFLVGG